MPWKRKKLSSSRSRLLFIALTAATVAGILSCLLGSLLDERGSALLNKYAAYRSLLGNHSAGEIQAALEKRGISGR